MEGHREGLRIETPKGPSVRLLCDERETEAVLEFLRDTGVWCMVARRRPPEQEGEDSECEEGGPDPP